MITLGASTSVEDVNGALAILAAVANPESAQKSLLELRTVLSQVKEAQAAAHADAVKAAEDRAGAEKAVAELASKKAAFDREQKVAKRTLEERAEALAAQTVNLERRELETSKRMAERQAALLVREESVERRELEVGAREKSVKEVEASVIGLRSELESKLGRLKAAIE